MLFDTPLQRLARRSFGEGGRLSLLAEALAKVRRFNLIALQINQPPIPPAKVLLIYNFCDS